MTRRKEKRHKQVNIWTEDHELLKTLSRETKRSMSNLTKDMLKVYTTPKKKKKKKNDWIKKTTI